MRKTFRALLLTGLVAAGTDAAVLAAGVSISVPFQTTVVSADGTTLMPPGAAKVNAAPATGGIATTEGVWTFGTPPNASGDYPLLLNGSNANGGFADLLRVTNGNLYGKQHSGQYSVRWGGQWHATAAAPAEGVTANAVALTVLLPKIPDSAPAGTVVATAQVTMSPAAAKFGGALVSSNPLFAARGTDIVLTRALSSTDDAAAVHSTITAVQ